GRCRRQRARPRRRGHPFRATHPSDRVSYRVHPASAHQRHGKALTGPEEFCRRMLPEVSRTFALNIPVLPAPLDLVVTVAYLLCRIPATLEGDALGNGCDRAGRFITRGSLG